MRPDTPVTQLGRAAVGERLRSPQGTWTVADSWIADRPGAEGKDRNYKAPFVAPALGEHVYYILTNEDGRQEEWSAPDMAVGDFHRIIDNQQTSLPE